MSFEQKVDQAANYMDRIRKSKKEIQGMTAQRKKVRGTSKESYYNYHITQASQSITSNEFQIETIYRKLLTEYDYKDVDKAFKEVGIPAKFIKDLKRRIAWKLEAAEESKGFRERFIQERDSNPSPIDLDEEDLQNIINLYQAGYTMSEIEHLYEGEISRSTISVILREVGVPTRGRGPDRFRRKRPHKNVYVDRLATLYRDLVFDEKLSLEEIEQMHVEAFERVEERVRDPFESMVFYAEEDED